MFVLLPSFLPARLRHTTQLQYIMDTVCSGEHGISLPSKTTLLLVNPTTGYIPSPEEVFNDSHIYKEDVFDFED